MSGEQQDQPKGKVADAETAAAPGASPHHTPYSWTMLVCGLAGLLAATVICGVLLTRFMSIRPVNLRPQSDAVADALEELLVNNQVPAASIHRTCNGAIGDGRAVWRAYAFDVTVPGSLSPEGLEKVICRAMQRHNITVSRAAGDAASTLSLYRGPCRFATACLIAAPKQAPGPVPEPASQGPPEQVKTVLATGSVEPSGLPQVQLPKLGRAVRAPDLDEVLSISLPDEEALKLESSDLDAAQLGLDARGQDAAAQDGTRAPARAAIIIDDGGYGGAVTEAVLALDPGLTLAILPNTPHATDTARDAAKLGFEVMLHMPMARCNFPGRLSTDMSEQQMRELTDNALAQVPGAAGVNNHAGSQFTADEKAMTRFLSCILVKSLFFVDSRTTAETKAHDVASAMGVRAASRDVFLDHESSPDYIRKQFAILIQAAKQQGQAIAIGHFRPNTAKVLDELIPTLDENGVKLVHVSELVK